MHLSGMRVRLAVLSAAIMSLVLAGLGIALIALFGTSVRESLDQLLTQDIETIERLLHFEDGVVELLWDNSHRENPTVNERLFVVRTVAGKVLLDSGGMAPALPAPNPVDINRPKDIVIDNVPYRMALRLHPKAHHLGKDDLLVQVARPLAPYRKYQRDLTKLILWLAPIPVLLVTILSWLAAGYSLQPLRRMIDKVRGMDAQRVHPQLPIQGGDEVGELAKTFNIFFDRLEASFNALRRFTADASHELRTPLAVIRTQVEVALSRDRSAPEYRASLEAVLEELARLQHLCELLLELTRGDAGSTEIQFQHIDISALVESWLERLIPVAEEKNLRLLGSVEKDMYLYADRRLLEVVVVNLLDNALAYTPAGGQIEVALVSRNGALLSVEDSGPGIAEADRERVFERFVRLANTRGSAHGAGLGLALVKWAVEAHGGKVHVEAGQLHGSRFVVFLPVNVHPAARPAS